MNSPTGSAVPLAPMTSPDPVLPQQATPAEVIINSVNWLFEPYWSGDRLIARLHAGRVTLTDEAGKPAGDHCSEAADELLTAIDADAAVIDGIWTAQPFVGDGSGVRQWAETLAEEGVEEPPDPISMETRRAFVALDLVELDGQSLADVPYQERRRLLTSVVEENVRVRISPAVKLPIRPWLHAWRGNGFTHYVAKHVNSRYRPGEQVEDWLIVSSEPEKYPSIAGRLMGQRPKKLRRIED
jgi:bifunctional non-homologous end joining protein LigD